MMYFMYYLTFPILTNMWDKLYYYNYNLMIPKFNNKLNSMSMNWKW